MAKVSVELELELQKLRADLASARGMMQSELARSFGGGGTGGLATSPSGIIQEMMRKTKTPSRVNYAQAGLGAAAGMFSPWIGATAINQSGILGSGGQGTQLGRLLGGLGVSGFTAAYVGLAVGAKLLKIEFDALRKSVRDATQLFFDAVRLRTSAGALKNADVVARALGVNNNTEIMQALAYGRGGMSPANMASMAGMQGQGATVGYIQHYTKDDKKFWDEMANNSRNFHVVWTLFSYNLDKLAAQMSNHILPAITDFVAQLNKMWPLFEKMSAYGRWQMSVVFAVPRWVNKLMMGGTDFGKPPEDMATNIGKYSLPQMGSLERIGYLIGSSTLDVGKQQLQVLKQIAANTSMSRGSGMALAGASKDRINIP